MGCCVRRALSAIECGPKKIRKERISFIASGLNPTGIGCKPPVPGKARCEECSQKASDWRQANPEKVCASASRRRALMAQVLSTLTPEQWLEILEYYDRRCAYCFVSEAEVGTLHMEHVMPIFRGGTNTPDNVVPACRSCNSSKGIKTLKEWLDD